MDGWRSLRGTFPIAHDSWRLLEADAKSALAPPETVPTVPDFFRFADDAEFRALLADQGFIDVDVRSLAFTHPVNSADELWDGLLHGTVRTSAVIHGQPEDVVKRIRAGSTDD